jgi:hypothetical protein
MYARLRRLRVLHRAATWRESEPERVRLQENFLGRRCHGYGLGPIAQAAQSMAELPACGPHAADRLAFDQGWVPARRGMRSTALLSLPDEEFAPRASLAVHSIHLLDPISLRSNFDSLFARRGPAGYARNSMEGEMADCEQDTGGNRNLNRRNMLFGSSSLLTAAARGAPRLKSR